MTDLKYSAFSNRAAEVLGPTVTAIPASRRAARPRPLTRGFGSVMQHTTLFHSSFNQGVRARRESVCPSLGGNMVPG